MAISGGVNQTGSGRARERRIFPLLYWIGLLIALTGLVLRFWLGWLKPGLYVALAGVALLLMVRVVAAAARMR